LSLKTEYRDNIIQLINELHEVILNSDSNFILDHRLMKTIDPDALIMLASEIKRCTVIKDIKLRYNAKYSPKNKEVKKMLNSIGYWEHFKIKPNDNVDDDKEYVKITDGNEASYDGYIEIRNFFDKTLKFIDDDYKIEEAYDEAITEAIANSVEHGYIKPQKIKTLDNCWWLSGFYDKQTRELFFTCYDQGIGLRKTLSYNSNSTVRNWFKTKNLERKNDSEIIKSLINDELPKYGKTDRGYGFKRFKSLINIYATGSVNIYSGKGHYHYSKKNHSSINEDTVEFKNKIHGTLIVWRLLIGDKK